MKVVKNGITYSIRKVTPSMVNMYDRGYRFNIRGSDGSNMWAKDGYEVRLLMKSIITIKGSAQDKRINAKLILEDTPKNRKRWRLNRNRMDIRGVDTRHSPGITPKRPKIGR
jgi:hypothetical protein